MGVTFSDIVNPFLAEIVLDILERSQELGSIALPISAIENLDQPQPILNRDEENQGMGPERGIRIIRITKKSWPEGWLGRHSFQARIDRWRAFVYT